MADAKLTGIACNACGWVYPAGWEGVCGECGSKARLFSVEAHASVETHASLALKQKRPGVKKPLVEQKQGDDYHRDSGQWRTVSRRVDRTVEPAWYSERIEDADGNVVREVDEPLSDHQGRGTARPATPCPTPERRFPG